MVCKRKNVRFAAAISISTFEACKTPCADVWGYRFYPKHTFQSIQAGYWYVPYTFRLLRQRLYFYYSDKGESLPLIFVRSC